jgi:hypothetical protein
MLWIGNDLEAVKFAVFLTARGEEDVRPSAREDNDFITEATAREGFCHYLFRFSCR